MIKKKYLKNKLNAIDVESYFENTEIDESCIKEFSNKYFNVNVENKSILGFDIYKYSDYDLEKQNLIPFIFDLLLDDTIDTVIKKEKTLFEHFVRKANFISTGDGGFLVFDTPIHALIFNFYFYSALHLFITGHFYPKLSKFIDTLLIRTTITYDKLYNYENNY
ncbi:hypothetical protein AGMMS50212_16340 [Spirochaetia bacterium]|nr:hypothetical protein AGMMS50212_16340 [Spirochaetia bacterium]